MMGVACEAKSGHITEEGVWLVTDEGWVPFILLSLRGECGQLAESVTVVTVLTMGVHNTAYGIWTHSMGVYRQTGFLFTEWTVIA